MNKEEKIEVLKDALDVLQKSLARCKKAIDMYQGALDEAVEILANNPPGDLDAYTPEMFSVLYNSKEHPEQWREYLLYQGLKRKNLLPEDKESN